MLFCVHVAWAQISIRGTVKSPTGEAVPGVNVVVKSTTNGTVTNVDGVYTITAPATLHWFSPSSVIRNRSAVDGRSTIDVFLKKKQSSIGEVVITALGIKTERNDWLLDTGSNRERYCEIKDVNVMSTLTGKVSGLTVQNRTGLFQSPNFTLRGKTPLIVLNGIPVSTDFYDIQSEDIESINVLKGTAASALYGSRGKDGAIRITTKSAGKEKLEVSISNSEMFSAGFGLSPMSRANMVTAPTGSINLWMVLAPGFMTTTDWGPNWIRAQNTCNGNVRLETCKPAS
jgi:TonB-dependent SusC/RagA subfamily outer membrane receptor